MSIGTKGVPRALREEQILDAAAEEFAKQGYAHVSVASVAARAGISKPLVYEYFGSKDGLAIACLRYVGDPLVKAVADAQTKVAPGQRAFNTLIAIFTALEGQRYSWSVLHDPTIPAGTEVADCARTYCQQLAELGAEGTAEVMSAAGYNDPLDHSLFNEIWQRSVGTVVQWWVRHPDQDLAEMATRCGHILTAIGLAE